MKPETFDTELRNLAILVGSWDSDELFNDFYLELLEKIKAGEDPDIKYSQVIRMRKILMIQSEFLINAWLRAKRESETKHDFCQ